VNSQANPAARLERLVPLLLSDPDNLPLHRECVGLAMGGGEYSRALELVDARLTRHPSEAESLYARSNALIGLKRYEEALDILGVLEKQGIAQEAVLKNLATCNYVMQRFENSRAYASQLFAAGDKSSATLNLLISSLHYLSEMDEAVKIADEHAPIAAADGLLAGSCAMVYLDMEQAQKAAKLAAVALAHNPDSIDGLTVQATLAAAEFRNDQALRQFSRVAELAPNHGRAWLGLGMLATLAQDFAQAKQLLARAVELMPTHLGSRHALAWAHLFSGDAQGAEKLFAEALEIDPTFAESHGAMAAMLAMRGEREAAEREIEVAERLDRSGLSSQFARAVLLGRVQGPDAAREFIRDAVNAAAGRFPGRAQVALRKATAPRPEQKKPS
jgi:tetratricopeptide (TPR) repeat protein